MLLQGWRNHRVKQIEIRKIRMPCNRSRCHKFVNWCGNLNYFDPEHNDLRIGWSWTNSSCEVDFPALKFQSVKLFSKIPYRNENSPTIHHTPVKISSTSMIGHATSTWEVVWLNTRIQRFPIPEEKMPKSLKCGRLQRVVLLERVIVHKNVSWNTLTHSVYHAAIQNRNAARFWDSEMEEAWSRTWVAPELLPNSGPYTSLASDKEFTLFCKSRIWAIIWHTIVRFLCCCMDNSSVLPCLAWSVSSQQNLLDSSIFFGNSLQNLHGRALSLNSNSPFKLLFSLNLICPSTCLMSLK